MHKVKVRVSQSCLTPGQNTGVGSLSLLQGIFPTQGSNPGLLHCRQILYQLNNKGSPRILECIAYHLSSGSSQPSNQTGISCNAGRFFTNWAIREGLRYIWLRKWTTHHNSVFFFPKYQLFLRSSYLDRHFLDSPVSRWEYGSFIHVNWCGDFRSRGLRSRLPCPPPHPTPTSLVAEDLYRGKTTMWKKESGTQNQYME